jgi:hypothetical protein
MKKLVSISFILLSLVILTNCSPKTAKKTASSEERTKSEPQDKVASEIAPVNDVVIEESVKVTPPRENSKGVTKLDEMSSDQQLMLFSDMAPLRVEMGKKIYTTNCNKCHDYYSPSSRSSEKWVDVMRTMGPKAKLNTDQYLMVAGYLVQNSKK